MSSPINPILVVRNNVAPYVEELQEERLRLELRGREIDDLIQKAAAIGRVLGVEVPTMEEVRTMKEDGLTFEELAARTRAPKA